MTFCIVSPKFALHSSSQFTTFIQFIYSSSFLFMTFLISTYNFPHVSQKCLHFSSQFSSHFFIVFLIFHRNFPHFFGKVFSLSCIDHVVVILGCASLSSRDQQRSLSVGFSIQLNREDSYLKPFCLLILLTILIMQILLIQPIMLIMLRMLNLVNILMMTDMLIISIMLTTVIKLKCL